jgi:hypothetical protein
MSRNQWIVLGALAVAVLITFAYLLTYLWKYGASLTSGPVQPAHLPTTAPAETAAPAASVAAADYGYRLCVQDVAAASTELVTDLGTVSSMGADDPAALCETAAGLDLQNRAAELRQSHRDCPVPSDPNLVTARGYLESGLEENVQAAELIGRHCSGDSSGDWLAEVAAHAERGSELAALADQAMDAYYTSY